QLDEAIAAILHGLAVDGHHIAIAGPSTAADAHDGKLRLEAAGPRHRGAFDEHGLRILFGRDDDRGLLAIGSHVLPDALHYLIECRLGFLSRERGRSEHDRQREQVGSHRWKYTVFELR